MSGREAPRAVGRPHRPWGCAQDKSIPCSTPSVAQGARWRRGPHAAATAGTVPASGYRVFHLHQACMDHPLEVARQREVDGKPHPTAPSHPQAPKPVGALHGTKPRCSGLNRIQRKENPSNKRCNCLPLLRLGVGLKAADGHRRLVRSDLNDGHPLPTMGSMWAAFLRFQTAVLLDLHIRHRVLVE